MSQIQASEVSFRFGAPSWGDRIQLFHFLNENLRPDSNWSIEEEYPLFFQETNFENLRVAYHGDQIVAHAGVRFFIVKTHFGLVKIAAIGSVVTHSSFRSQGLSQTLLQQLCDKAYLEGADIAILWTDLHDFYRKIGFELAGSELTIELNADFSVPSSPQHNYLLDQKVSSEALLKPFLKHSVNSLRKVTDIDRYLRIPNSRIHSVWDKTNKLLAYAIEGKGADLQGYVHEWGGDTSALMALFSQVRQKSESTLRILVSPHHQNLLRQLKDHSGEEYQGCLCMMKWIDPDRMFRKLNVYAAQMGVKNFNLSREDQLYKLQVGSSLFQTDHGTDFIPLLFGPTRPSDFAMFDAESVDQLSRVFPLPFWIWGWDSV